MNIFSLVFRVVNHYHSKSAKSFWSLILPWPPFATAHRDSVTTDFVWNCRKWSTSHHQWLSFTGIVLLLLQFSSSSLCSANRHLLWLNLIVDTRLILVVVFRNPCYDYWCYTFLYIGLCWCLNFVEHEDVMKSVVSAWNFTMAINNILNFIDHIKREHGIYY